MMKMMGATNTRGFSSSVSKGVLPPDSHITYEGVFNQLQFYVGPKTEKTIDCHFGYARYQFAESLNDSNMKDYLCMFLKSQRDGAERNQIPLNAVICLDISGSMSGCLQKGGKQSRLQLSIEAIKMFISKLRPDDSIGMVVFDTKADIVFEQTLKKDFDSKLFELSDNQTTRGGTTIAAGLVKSKQILKTFLLNNEISNAQNRIIMLTDVGDNSISGSLQFVREASKNDSIHLTIAGVSNQFRSQTCEVLKNVKGFNYFCAINDEDIKKNIFEEFNFNFLPVVHNVQITLESANIISFQTFGAPDSSNVKQYNDDFKGERQSFIVSRTASVFPSSIQIKDGEVFTIGGVILIKLDLKQKKSSFRGQIKIKYLNLAQQNKQEIFQLKFDFPQKQQFYSEQCLRQALQGYAFTSEIKNLLVKAQTMNQKDSYQYVKLLSVLKVIAPCSKKGDLQSIQKILQNKRQIKQAAK